MSCALFLVVHALHSNVNQETPILGTIEDHHDPMIKMDKNVSEKQIHGKPFTFISTASGSGIEELAINSLGPFGKWSG